MAQGNEGRPEIPIFTDTEMAWYRLQATALLAFKMGVITDFVPRTNEQFRSAISDKDPKAIQLLDSLADSYQAYYASVRKESPDQWERRKETETARSRITEYFSS